MSEYFRGEHFLRRNSQNRDFHDNLFCDLIKTHKTLWKIILLFNGLLFRSCWVPNYKNFHIGNKCNNNISLSEILHFTLLLVTVISFLIGLIWSIVDVRINDITIFFSYTNDTAAVVLSARLYWNLRITPARIETSSLWTMSAGSSSQIC